MQPLRTFSRCGCMGWTGDFGAKTAKKPHCPQFFIVEPVGSGLCRSALPFPIGDLGHIRSILADILAVLDELVLHFLNDGGGAVSE